MRISWAVLLIVIGATSALAQGAPEIVIPGRAGVPVYINGVDASWGIIERDFGLDRPGMAAPTIVYLPHLRRRRARVPAYYPADGRHPAYGRLEIVPRRRVLPPPAPPYFREWSSSSGPAPATTYPRYAPTIIAPTIAPNLHNRGTPHQPRRSARNHKTP